jgi:hypothetical protein
MHYRSYTSLGLLGLLTVVLCLPSGCKKKPSDKKKTAPKAPTADMRQSTQRKGGATPSTMSRTTATAGTKKTARSTDKAYTVRLVRAKTVGMRYRLLNEGDRKTGLTIDGKVVPKQSQAYTWTYEALVTVKEVNPKGRATREVHQVERFTITQGGKTRTAAPKGATIVAYVRAGREEFKINGEPAPDTVDDVLEVVVSLANRNSKVSTDDIFAPTGAVKVGARWEINKAKMVEDLVGGRFKKAVLQPTPAHVTGRARLMGIKPMRGVPSLWLQASARIRNIAPPAGPVKVKRGVLVLRLIGYVPVDTKTFGGGLHLNLHMIMTGELTRDGRTAPVKMLFKQSTRDHKIPLKDRTGTP